MRNSFKRSVIAGALAIGCASLVACGSNEPTVESVTLVAYESFTPPDGAFDAFTESTGITVEVVAAGDAGVMVSKAVLTAGNPEGDVMWGVDNTLLSRAIDGRVFDPYESDAAPIDPALDGFDVVTPVDYGDVCVNYDVAALERLGVEPPATFADLANPAYRDLLVMPSATTSSTGLAFLLGTIAHDPDGWEDTWRAVAANGLLVVDGWYEAYYTEFTRYGGSRPFVVSYASSPPAEVIFAEPPLPPGAPAPTSVVTTSCFRQIEYAGVLRGTKKTAAARRLVDYMIARDFQEMLPESLFVFPANSEADLPASFRDYAPTVTDPATMKPATIAESRDAWLEEWDAIVR